MAQGTGQITSAPLPTIAARGLAMFLIVGTLTGVAIFSRPSRSAAAIEGHSSARSLDRTQWPIIGELWSPRRIIRLHAGPEGTLYTVCSPDGTVLGAQLTGDELTRAFPDIDLPMLSGRDNGYQLMMADPD